MDIEVSDREWKIRMVKDEKGIRKSRNVVVEVRREEIWKKVKGR